MNKNEEGILWVKLLRSKPTPQNPSNKNTTLIPIRWAKASNLHKTEEQNVAALHGLSPHDHEHDVSNQDLKRTKDRGAGTTVADARKESSETSKGDVDELPPASSADGCGAGWRAAGAEDDGDGVCIVCMERAADFQLLPCRHDRFCRQCIVETICTWVRPEAPCCPLCRGAFHTMVLHDDDD